MCCPREALFIVVNVVFVVVPPQQATRERAFLSRGEVPLVGAVGGWPVGSPRGFALPLCARGLIAQGAAALVSAARGGRLEGGREREVGGELHRAGILRAAVAPLVDRVGGKH